MSPLWGWGSYLGGCFPVPDEPVGTCPHLFQPVVGIVAVAVDKLVGFPVLVHDEVYVAADKVIDIFGALGL
jgi:hypothetical protein